VSPDGQLLLLRQRTPTTGNDLSLLRLDGKSQPTRLLQMSFGENNADLSADGKWLAYQSDESGRPEVFVRPFPNVDAGRWQVSSGGTKPRWAPNGQELFYVSGGVMGAPIQSVPTFLAKPAARVLQDIGFNNVPGRPWDVSTDGRRFLMIQEPAANRQSNAASMVVVLNAFDGLKAH
jgi:serine/threonine-protein kinase